MTSDGVLRHALSRRSPFPSFVCILLCSSLPLSFACLATLRVDFFKVLRIQYLDVQRVCR
jgi:hypothetical protein